MIRAYDAASGGAMNAAEEIIRNPREWENSPHFPFYADAAKLLIEAREAMDKANTSGSVLTALKRIYKSAAALDRKGFDGFFKSGDRWALCDGYRFVRLNNKPDSIPEVWNDMDLDKTIPQGAKYAEEIPLPTVADIKAFIAEKNMTRSKPGPFEAAPGWWCNPFYLLDMIQALPGGKAHRPERPMAAMYYESDDGDAVLLPVRHNAA